MPDKNSNFIVRLLGYDPSCKAAVTASLLQNQRKKGKLWATQMLTAALAGAEPTVYESNGVKDGWAAARLLMLSGAKVALFEVHEDGTLTETSIAT